MNFRWSPPSNKNPNILLWFGQRRQGGIWKAGERQIAFLNKQRIIALINVGPHNLRAIVYILGKPYKQRGETRARVVSNKRSNSTRPLIVKLCILWASAKFTCLQRCAVCADSGTKERALGDSLHRVVGVREVRDPNKLSCGWQSSVLVYNTVFWGLQVEGSYTKLKSIMCL